MPNQDTAVKNGSEDTSTATSAPADNTNSDTSTAVDTDNQSEVNTSPQIDDDDFADIDEANPIKAEDAESESSDEDNDEDEDKVTDKEADGDKKPEAPEDKEVSDKTETDKSPDDTKPRNKEARVEQLNKEINDLKAEMGLEPNTDVRSLVAERNALKELQSTQIRKAGLDLEHQLLDMTDPETGEPYAPEDASRIARTAVVEVERAQLGQEAYTLGVQRNQQVMERETLQAMHDFPIFMEKLPDGSDNPDYDKDLAELAGQHLMDAFVLEDGDQQDKDGNPIPIVINIKRSPYQIMKSVADQATRLKSQTEADKAAAEANAASNIAKQASGADVPVNSNSTVGRVDQDVKDFDDAFDSYDL